MRWGIWFAAALTLAASSVQAQASDDGPYAQLFETLWATVDAQYYDPKHNGADWAGVRTRYAPRARTVDTDSEFAQLASEMLREIGSSHLNIVPPARAAVARAGLGARFLELDGETILSEVSPLSDAWHKGLRPGDRLLASIDSLRGPLGERASVSVEHCDGRRAVLDVRREQAFWPPERPGFRWRQIRTSADERIGYLRIDRFDDGAADLADQAMADLSGSAAIIIDLRWNTGGNASALRLASYFAPGAEPAFALLNRAYLDRLGRRPTAADILAAPRVARAYTTEAVMEAVTSHDGGMVLWTEEVPTRFTRPLFLLLGPDTGSAAEGFAWYMRLRTQARLVGRTTEGALLSSDTLDIGHGWSVTLPVHGNWGPDGQDFGDKAVEPHVAVEWRRADYCDGRDPDLAMALRLAEAAR
jgi:carboxyl-terminal processing protease